MVVIVIIGGKGLLGFNTYFYPLIVLCPRADAERQEGEKKEK